MHKILHRVNTIALLEKTPSNFGVEVDIRSYGGNLIIHHDPFKQGELFTSKNIRSIRPGYGLHPKFYDSIIGKKAHKNMVFGEKLTKSELN